MNTSAKFEILTAVV